MSATSAVMGTKEWLLLIALSIVWGGSFFFVEIALEDLPPFTLVLLRVSFAAAALYTILKVAGGKLPTSWRTWQAFFVMAMLNNAVPFSLLVWG